MITLASSKSTTVWNGTVNLVDGYTVESGEILIVEAGTQINLGDDKDILVAGRMTVQGTSSSPVILNSIMGNHDGLIFNSSSNGLGSKIDNLTIRNSEYGVTIYGSNPILNNLRVENAPSGYNLYGGSVTGRRVFMTGTNAPKGHLLQFRFKFRAGNNIYKELKLMMILGGGAYIPKVSKTGVKKR